MSPAKSARQGSGRFHGPRRAGGLVWVVDDDADIRGLLRDVLESSGHIVRDAPNGYSFVSRLAEETQQIPDLVVLDIRMPGWTGLEVMHWMRENGWSVPIVVITADPGDRVCEEAMNLGAVEVYHKPFDLIAFAEDVTRRLG